MYVEATYDAKRPAGSFRNFMADMILVYYLLACAKLFEKIGKG